MQAHELQAYLQTLNGGWVHPEKTVDTYKSGSPDAEIRGIAVAWMTYTWALRQAVELECNVFVTHEPTYYNHWDNDPTIMRMQGVLDKQTLIDQNSLVILRCHDLWDQMPEIGIPDSWAHFLGLGPAMGGQGYFRVYGVAGKTALEVAQAVAGRTRHLGQETVQLIGPADKPVTRACIGTGAITPFLTLVKDFQADLVICTDDGITYWRDAAFAIDMDIPMIVVNHPVSEEAGMVNLAKHLQARFPHIPVHHIPQRCMFRLVEG
jgi:putative NIF3 family GTP cyclohydrolase 1 type 2